MEESNYFIKDLGVGYGVFVKQDQPVTLKDNMLINVGEAYIVVNLVQGEEDQNDSEVKDLRGQGEVNLKLKIFGGPSGG